MAELKNKRKRYYHIDENTSSNEVFAILSEVESNDESEIDDIMNDSDTEFISIEPLTQPDEEENRKSAVLVPEANVHVVSVEPERSNDSEVSQLLDTAPKVCFR